MTAAVGKVAAVGRNDFSAAGLCFIEAELSRLLRGSLRILPYITDW